MRNLKEKKRNTNQGIHFESEIMFALDSMR